MRRRIFIAINLSDTIKRRLLEFQKKSENMFVSSANGRLSGRKDQPWRWTKKDNLHLTLVFIGYAEEQEIYEICRASREIAQKHEPFFINFERILYGPPGKPARMIWLKGQENKELTEIKQELEEGLVSLPGLRGFREERHFFSPHITLARANFGSWRSSGGLPEINEEFKQKAEVLSIDVMESDLKKSGPQYTILESCPLGENKI